MYPTARRPRSPFLAPLIALSALLVVLVVAIVVVAVGKTGGGTPQGRGSTAPGIDPCLVGAWRVTSHLERVSIDGFGTVTFVGSGAVHRLAADGTGVTDYGTGTQFEGTAAGRTIRLTLSGRVTFRYQTAGDVVSFADLSPQGAAVVSVDGIEVARPPLAGSEDPAAYACSRERLTETTHLYRVEMVRED